jgi:uncharacterized membrane protein
MIEVKLYSRKECHLCEQTQQDLSSLQEEVPHQVLMIDIDEDPKLQKLYGNVIPVIEVGPYRLQAPFTLQDLQITMKAAQLNIRQDQAIEDALQKGDIALERGWTKNDRFSYWMSCHYLGFFNVLISLYLGLAFLAPVMQKIGAKGPANILYTGYGFLCHQLAYRSWFIFGEQAIYPTAAAGIKGLKTYEEMTGLNPEIISGLWDARSFRGNEQMGYKVALCERDTAIYAAMLLFGLVYALLRGRFPHIQPIPWYIWILFGMVPIGLDGGSQLLSQFFPQINKFLPYRESTPLLRVLTGALFGVFTAWFGYPYVEESMSETRTYMKRRLERLKESHGSDHLGIGEGDH